MKLKLYFFLNLILKSGNIIENKAIQIIPNEKPPMTSVRQWAWKYNRQLNTPIQNITTTIAILYRIALFLISGITTKSIAKANNVLAFE